MIRCWQCSAEPELVEISRLGQPQPEYMIGRWPAGDHEHREYPPTPSELIAAGYAALARILAEWAR